VKPIAHYFLMDAEKWRRQRAKGFWYYIFIKGVICLGIGGGVLIFTLQYWQDTSFSLSGMSLFTWFSDYLVWLPITIAAGLIVSALVWLEFEDKYGNKG